MKRQIRKGVFETNSSSVHSLVMCKKDDYDMWIEGKMLLTRYDELIPLTDEQKEERKKTFLKWVEYSSQKCIEVRNAKEDLIAHADTDDYIALTEKHNISWGMNVRPDLIYEFKWSPGITVIEYNTIKGDNEELFSTKDDYVAFGYFGLNC